MHAPRNTDPATMTIPVEVVTRDLSDPDAPPRRNVVDHNVHSDRLWLGKHSYWAIRNGHSVTTAPIV